MECGGKNQIVEVEELMRNEDKTMSIDCVSKSLAKKKRERERERELAVVGL